MEPEALRSMRFGRKLIKFKEAFEEIDDKVLMIKIYPFKNQQFSLLRE